MSDNAGTAAASRPYGVFMQPCVRPPVRCCHQSWCFSQHDASVLRTVGARCTRRCTRPLKRSPFLKPNEHPRVLLVHVIPAGVF
jgi:hypothetical protein